MSNAEAGVRIGRPGAKGNRPPSGWGPTARFGGYTRRRLNSSDHVPHPLYFEELPLGGTWTTRRRTVTAADLAAFSGAVGEMNPLLIDEPQARAGFLRGPVAPGTFVAAAAVGLGSIDAPVPATVGMVGMSWRFLKPVRPGDTIQTRWRLFRKRSVENPAWGLAFWHIEVLDPEGQRVAEGEVSRLVARRVAAAAVSETPASRSRRGRRGGSAERVTEVVESTPLPEPAPADAPPPSRRRRRRGGSRSNGSGARQEAPPKTAPEPPPAPAPGPAPAPVPAPARRSGLGGVLRRLRGS